jgi:hypothetical protein
MTREQVRVGGVWLNDVGPWGGLSYSTKWPGGCDEATVTVYLPPTFRHPALSQGKRFEVMDGSSCVWLGQVGHVDWSTGEVTADGLYAAASRFPSLAADGTASARAGVAVDQAISRGAPWSGRSGFPTLTIADAESTNGLNTVAQVLDAAADESGLRWAVFEDGIVAMSADPTSPKWQIAPGLVELGQDDTEFATQLVVRYFDSGTSSYTTLIKADSTSVAMYGVVEQPVDLTGWGPMTASKATAKANGILAKGRARLGWTNSVTVGPYQLKTMGDLPADLSMVKAGQVVRAHGIYDARNLTPYRDLVIGKCSYSPGDGTVTLEPVDTQPQTLADVVEAVMRRARRKPLAS